MLQCNRWCSQLLVLLAMGLGAEGKAHIWGMSRQIRAAVLQLVLKFALCSHCIEVWR